MTDREIKAASRLLNKKNYLKSTVVLLSAAVGTLFFTVLPLAALNLFKLTEFKESSPSAYYGTVIIALVLFTLWAFFAYSSFSLGEKAWYAGRMTRKKECVRRLLFWFSPKRSFKAVRLRALLFVLKLAWLIVFISPALLVLSGAVILAYTGGVEIYLFIALAAGGAVLLICGLIFHFVTVQRYFLSEYLAVANPRLGVVQAVSQSKNLLDGHLWRIVKFKLGFLPAFLLYPAVLPVIFLHPYYKQSCCVIAKEICL